MKFVEYLFVVFILILLLLVPNLVLAKGIPTETGKSCELIRTGYACYLVCTSGSSVGGIAIAQVPIDDCTGGN